MDKIEREVKKVAQEAITLKISVPVPNPNQIPNLNPVPLTKQNSKDVNAREVADGIFALSTRLYSVARHKDQDGTSGNLLYSPFSLMGLFGMLKIGTRGATSKEMEKLMFLPMNDSILCSGFKEIFHGLEILKSSKDFKMTSANRIYVENRFKILDTYVKTLTSYFDGGIKKVMLQPSAAKEINKWVQETTGGLIRGDILTPDDLHEEYDPKLVLINAIYFKGLWEQRFRYQDTIEQDFYLTDKPKKQTIRVDMMHKDGRNGEGFRVYTEFLKDFDADVFEMPYKGGRFSMLIYLPRTITGLSKIERNLANLPTPSEILRSMKHKKYQLRVPRFKIETKLDLIGTLNQIGVKKIFSIGGDFSGMKAHDEENFHVTTAIQKAVLVVDEKGAEAPAASSIVINKGSKFGSPKPVEESPVFKCDHPFFFQIVDKNLHLVLFSGACTHPSPPQPRRDLDEDSGDESL